MNADRISSAFIRGGAGCFTGASALFRNF